MNAFISIVSKKCANALKAGDMAEGRDGVYRTVKLVKPRPKANGANAYVVSFAGGRIDSFDADEIIKTK